MDPVTALKRVAYLLERERAEARRATAFRTAARLGGFGVLVGPARHTLARHRLPDTPAVADWLTAVAGERP